MNSRTVLVAMLAVACGTFAAVGVFQLQHQSGALRDGNADQLVTAKADIPRGQLITADLVEISRHPKDKVPKGTISNVDDAMGRATLVPIVKGELVLESKLAGKNSGRGMAATIPDGMRAFTIQTPQVTTDVGGFMMPGNRVDVLLTTNSSTSGGEDSTGGSVTTTLLQNIQVLAVAQNLDMPDNGKIDPSEVKSATLLVTPDQAAKLSLGMNKGILHLSLRNPNDNREAKIAPVTLAQLRFEQGKPFEQAFLAVAGALKRMFLERPEKPAAAPPPPPEPALAEIRTLRGSSPGSVIVKMR
jgi:pilus assembly protein CpaB